jgi:hypothetical protein
MKITLDIADADIEMALRTAAESGIGYWVQALMFEDIADAWVVYAATLLSTR